MRVPGRDPRGARIDTERSQDAGFPHSNEPETPMRVELWAGVTQNGWSPVIWIPMKRDPEGCEAEGRGLGKHQANETRAPEKRSK